MIKPFESTVFQLFLDLLRAGGTQPNIQQVDKLRQASFNFSEAFKAQVLVTTMELLKEFQGNVKESMDELETRLKAMEATAWDTDGNPVGFPIPSGEGIEATKVKGNDVDVIKIKIKAFEDGKS